MADHIIAGDSKEAVAFALLLGIAHKEKKVHALVGSVNVVSADEEWVLTTYKKCLAATHWVPPT